MPELANFVGDGPCGAVLDESRKYRYSLWRRWRDDGGTMDLVAFVGLNPSTADEKENDPTIRRCIDFAQRWGFHGLVMLNIFAFRATDPKVMRREFLPTGELNDEVLRIVSASVGKTICAWGTDGQHLNRGPCVKALLLKSAGTIFHLGLTKFGHPKHPLYLPKLLQPIPWL